MKIRLNGSDLKNGLIGYLPETLLATGVDFGQDALILDRLVKQGLSVPAGMALNSSWCKEHIVGIHTGSKSQKSQKDAFAHSMEILRAKMSIMLNELARISHKRFGNSDAPLFLVIQPSLRPAIPDFMRSAGYIGLDTAWLASQNNQEQSCEHNEFRHGIYYHFLASICRILADFEIDEFNQAVSLQLKERSETRAQSVSARIEAAQKVFYKLTGKRVPQKPEDQLLLAMHSVWSQWHSRRGQILRQAHGLMEEEGPALIVQQMILPEQEVHDNLWSGEIFTRHPETGKEQFVGEVTRFTLLNKEMQFPEMETEALSQAGQKKTAHNKQAGFSLQPIMPVKQEKIPPGLLHKIQGLSRKLEQIFGKVQKFSFIADNNDLHIAQTQTAQCSTHATLALVTSLVEQGKIPLADLLMNLEADALTPLLHPVLDPDDKGELLGTGIPASPGAASGALVFKAIDAVELSRMGKPVVLLCARTGPEDIPGMKAAQALVTTEGGTGSHAACIARTVGTPCVTNLRSFLLDEKEERVEAVRIDGTRITISKHQNITVDGESGNVYLGLIKIIPAFLPPEFYTVMAWCDQVPRMQVRTNIDHPDELVYGMEFNAEGVGLVRTEHMFQSPAAFQQLQTALFNPDPAQRSAALQAVRRAQHVILSAILRGAENLPVTIRLIDAPLHEFLPDPAVRKSAMGNSDLTDGSFVAGEEALRSNTRMFELASVREQNPMMGHRGCRLSISHPDILEIQVHAMMDAAHSAQQKGIVPQIEIVIPFVNTVDEVIFVKERIEQIILERKTQDVLKMSYKIGVMIEIPRAALVAGEIAQHCDFLSFGTNDLTQLTWGVSRDDAAPTFQTYKLRNILDADPFKSLDTTGVGELLKLAVSRARMVNPHIVCGVCGEHASDPKSVRFFDQIGINYISCTPFRVPIARLAAAQAVLARSEQRKYKK